jgi:hypothetical protein
MAEMIIEILPCIPCAPRHQILQKERRQRHALIHMPSVDALAMSLINSLVSLNTIASISKHVPGTHGSGPRMKTQMGTVAEIVSMHC